MIENFDLPKILKRALKNGGNFAELFEELSWTSTLQKEDRRFQKLSRSFDGGVGLRVIYGEKTAYAYTNELSEASLLVLAEQMAAAIRAKAWDRDISLQARRANWAAVVKRDPSTVPMEEKAGLLTKADSLAWETNALIRQVTTTYRDQIREVRIANSLGQLSAERQTYLTFFVQAVAAKDDDVQTGYEPFGGTLGFEAFGESAALETARLAAERAVLMLTAKAAPSGAMPVVLSSAAGGTMVHEAVGHGLEADLAMEGLSVYEGKIGARVANDLITVLDDPTVPGKRGSFLFDDEGTPAQRNVLIEKGILKSYMLNRLYAWKAGSESTGNGRRESYQHRPIVRMTNTMIASGNESPEAILKSVERGLFVERMGGGQVNTVNGDFVFEVSEGYLIEKGKLDRPVRGATLTGNGPAVLMSIDMVGDDLGFGMGTCGKDGQGVPVADAQPTLRIPELTVGGSA